MSAKQPGAGSPGGDDGERISFGWFIPTAGDTAAGFGHEGLSIPQSMDHFERVAGAAEHAGFEYALVPVTTRCWEAWISCAMVAARTERLKMLVAVRPGYISPLLMARMITTFDQLSQGRIYINLIAGPGGDEEGIPYGHDERYEVMDETVTLMKRLWTEEEPFTHSGRHFRTRGAVVQPRPFQQPHPPFYIGGVSPASWPVIGKHADVYLAWGDTVGHIAQTFAVAKRAAADHGREHELRLGVRIQVCVRDDEEQAWRDAEALIADVTDEQRERRITSQLESHIDARMKELARAGEHRIGPHLWSGLTTARGGGAVMIVGNPEQVAETIEEYIGIGTTTFCLSGFPHHTEAERFGRLVMPYFADRRAPEAISATVPSKSMPGRV